MIDEKVMPNFWLSEFLLSDTAVRWGLDNTPTEAAMANIRNVLAPRMQRVREFLQTPIQIRSGYRSPEVNKAVGGAENSQHCEGLAADFTAPSFGMPLTIAKALLLHSGIKFDQLIQEGGWVHLSFTPLNPRGQVLTAHFVGGRVTYTPGLA